LWGEGEIYKISVDDTRVARVGIDKKGGRWRVGWIPAIAGMTVSISESGRERGRGDGIKIFSGIKLDMLLAESLQPCNRFQLFFQQVFDIAVDNQLHLAAEFRFHFHPDNTIETTGLQQA